MSEIRLRPKYVTVVHANPGSVAERWWSQYKYSERGSTGGVGDKILIYDELIALGPMPSAEDVARVIGNKSWSYLMCDGCNSYELTLVSIGEYEAKSYCKTCIAEANQVAMVLP